MALVEPPAGTAGVEARRVESFEEFVEAAEIVFETFGVPEAERERDRVALPGRWLGCEAVTSIEILLDGPR